MLLDEESRLAPKPCRSLMVNGQWSADAPEALKQRPLVVPYQERSKDVPVMPREVPERPRVVAKPPVRPHGRPPKPKDVRVARKVAARPNPEKRQSFSVDAQPGLIPGKGAGWNRRPEIDLARIVELRKQGMTQAQISVELGCHRSAISKWLVKQANASEAAAAEFAERRKCSCGRKKLVVDDACWRCREYRRAKDERAISRKAWKAASADLTAKMAALCGEGRTAREIAEQLNTTMGAVYTRLHRAKAAAKESA